MFRVELEPLPLWKVGRIKDTIPPMRIVIATCSDKDHISKGEGFKDSRVQGFQSPERILDSKPSPTHDENRTNSGHGHVFS
jgi:hypothetical protein